MNNFTLLKSSMIGTAVISLCCFTPVLDLLLDAIGLSAWVEYVYAVLVPALIVFAGLTMYALIRKEIDTRSKTGVNKTQK